MKIYKISRLTLALVLLVQGMNAQLSGTYTINSALPTAGTNFASITDFTDELNDVGVSGPVIANIVTGSGPYDEFVRFGYVSGVSATNTITLNGNGETVEYDNTSSDRQLLILDSARFVTVNNIVFKSLDATYGWGAIITNESYKDSIKNCTFDMSATTSTSSGNAAGIIFSDSYTSSTSTGATGKSCYIGNNTIIGPTGSGGMYYALRVNGSDNDSMVIADNEIRNFYMYGIYISDSRHSTIIGNEVHRSTKTDVSTFYGIYVTGDAEGVQVLSNRVHSPQAPSGTASSTSYMLYMGGDGTSANPVLVANNAVYNVNMSGSFYGIYGNGATYNNYYHNSVSIDQVLTGTSTMYAARLVSPTGCNFKNNLINITGGTSGSKYGVYYTTDAFDDVQRNMIYLNSSTGTAYYAYLGAAYTDIASFQAAYPALEVGSVSVDPMLISPATGNLEPANTGIAAIGENLSTIVTEDINGMPRTATPTPGCYQVEAVANNIATMELVAPLTYCPGSETIIAKIANFGTNTVSTYTINWSIDGTVQPPVSITTPLGAAGTGTAIQDVTIGTYTFPAAPVVLKIWTSNPNGASDTDPTNDTITVTLSPALSGTYTINSGAATAGTNFASIGDFTDALMARGVCGPVVANIVAGSGPYEEFIEFGNIPGASATNTIRLNGNGETVEYENDATNRQLLIFNGASYVTVEDIHFEALDTDYGWGAIITNNSYKDSIKDCTFDLSAVSSTSSANSSGIVFSGSLTSATTSGLAGKNCYIGGNHLIGPTGSNGYYYGISIYSGGNDSNVVENNEVENFYYYGIYLSGANDCKIIGNDVHRSTKDNSTAFYGIYTTGVTEGAVISRNRVHDPKSASSTATGSNYMMYLLGDGSSARPVIVSNNVVYNLNRGGTIYGIYGSTSPYNYFYHNSVSIDQVVSGSSNVYGFYMTGTNTGTELKNNMVNLTGGSGGNNYTFYYSSPTAISDAQGNMFYENSTATGTSYFGYHGTDYTDLASFQAAYPALETGSISVNPMLIAPATGNLEPANSSMAVAGVDVITTVPDDINGDPRTIAPTPGAYQIDPLANNAATTELVSPVAFCTGTHDIVVKVRNYGSNTINTLTVNWMLNGVLQPPIALSTPIGPITGTTPPNFIDLTLTTYTFTTAPVDLKVWTSNPNGSADTDPTNDTLTATLQAALGGYITINSTMPTGGSNYNSLSEFVYDLNTYGVCSPIQAEVIEGTGPYEETVNFGDIPGSSEINTVRLFGHMDTVKFTNTSTQRSMLTFNGTKYVTVEGLVFKNLASDYGWAAHITNGSYKDSVKNCFFDMTAISSSSSASTSGIVFSGSNTSPSTAGSNGRSCYIGGNTILATDASGGPYYGLIIYGSDSEDNDSNVIVDNVIQNFYYYGAYLYGAKHTQFLRNNINRSTKTVTTTFYGIYTSLDISGTQIRDNRVHSGKAGSGSTSSFYGIYLFGDGVSDSVVIANNAVYNVKQGGLVYGLYISAGLENKIYHNSISIESELSGTSANYGLYFTGTNTGTTAKNNLVSITGGTEGTKYGFYYSTAASINDPQRNMFYVNSPSGTNNYGYLTTAYTTMAAFQAANPTMEIGSMSVDPQLADAAGGALMPTNPSIEGNGLNLTAIVPEDIMGDTRPVPPTPGCWERDVTQLNNAAAISFINPVDPFCEGEHEILMVVENLGLNGISSLNINYTLDGTPGSVTYSDYIPGVLSTPNNRDTISLGVHYFTVADPMEIIAYTSNPNGAADMYPVNDTAVDTFTADYRMPVDLGADTSICKNHTIVLDAGIPGAEYLWNTGETTQTITVDTHGTYYVQVKTDEGCFGYDTIQVSDIIVNIGLGMTDTPCIGDYLVLDAGNPGSTYFWSTGESTQTITVNDDGEYYVVVTTPQGCVEYDTVQVVFSGYPPSLTGIGVNNLAPLIYNFEPLGPLNVTSYFWDFGDDIGTSPLPSPTYEYTEEGTYLVTCTVNSTCGVRVFETFVTVFTGLNDPKLSSAVFDLYPNPARNILTIEAAGGSIKMKTIAIINTLGQVIRTIPATSGSKLDIDVTALQSGMYHLRIETEDGGMATKSFQILK